MTTVGGLSHVTLLCTPGQFPGVLDFYERVIGLAVGPRPSFDFPGAWLYAGKEPIVHLAAVLGQDDTAATTSTSASTALPGASSSTGSIDHVALRVDSTVEACRAKLIASGVEFSEAPVPDFPLYQLFLKDPLGVKLELNLELKA